MKSKIMKRQNVRTLSLIVCTFTYLLVGAAIFDALESTNEMIVREELETEEKMLREKYNMTEQDFNDLRWNLERTVPYYAGIQWKFEGSFYFALTVITVIGYGHSTPMTAGGKIFCVGYALCGIPLCIIMFQSVGERLNVFITYTLKKIRKCLKLRNQEVSETHVILVTMNLSSFVLTCGALMFRHYEGWGFLDSVYYCFITLTTIGFGDLVALQKNRALQLKPEYVAFSLIFILFGLTVISAAMNLLVLRFLTMNAEDERRDEIEAAVAAQNAIYLDGDVIQSNSNGNIHVVSNAQERPDYTDVISVCSCSCYKWRFNENSNRRGSSIITGNRAGANGGGGGANTGKGVAPKTKTYSRDDNSSDETDSFLQYHSKRSSV